mmetsp:Transcript_85078/g.225932  ORF Transcript_85078/g.225932 Transcript_85078/m.225932 type:complete len:219 (-) Transcript_85078:765-1421(-)
MLNSHSKKSWALRGESSLWNWRLCMKSPVWCCRSHFPPSDACFTMRNLNCLLACPAGNFCEILTCSWPMMLTTFTASISCPAPSCWEVGTVMISVSPGFSSFRSFVSVPVATSPSNLRRPLPLATFNRPMDCTAGTLPENLASSSRAALASRLKAPSWPPEPPPEAFSAPRLLCRFRVMSTHMSSKSDSICWWTDWSMALSSVTSCLTLRMAVMAAKT